MNGYIYETTNNITGETYIGQHKTDGGEIDSSYLGSGVYLRKMIRKYGRENFSQRILYRTDDEEQLSYAELSFILKAKQEGKAEYNIRLSAQDATAGFWRIDKKFAKEVQDRSSATQREQAALMTEEERKEHYGNRKGCHLSEETKAQMSASSKKLWQNEEYRRKRSEALKNYYENGGEVWNKRKTGIFSQEQLVKIGQGGKTKMDNIRAQLPEGWVLVSDFVRETGITRAKILSHYECQETTINNCKLCITNKVEKEFVDGRGKWERK